MCLKSAAKRRHANQMAPIDSQPARIHKIPLQSGGYSYTLIEKSPTINLDYFIKPLTRYNSNTLCEE
jgi:hypothetical protein